MLKLLLILALGCWLRPSQAAFLQECEGVIISRVPNPNPDCSEYVYCNGDDSYYCNGDCTEPVYCYNSTQVPVPSSTEPSPTSSTAARETSIPTTTPITSTVSTTISSSSSSSSIQTSSSSTTTTTTTVVPSRSTTPSGNLYVICRTSGQNGVYPYPANNNYYYECLAGYLLLQQCPQNFQFVEALGQCIGPNPYQAL